MMVHFGLRPFLPKNNYAMYRQKSQGSIVLCHPHRSLDPFIASNTGCFKFLLENFAINTRNLSENDTIYIATLFLDLFILVSNQKCNIFRHFLYYFPLMAPKVRTAQEVPINGRN
jgi:hypothetical protein